MKKFFLLVIILLTTLLNSFTQNTGTASISIDFNKPVEPISPLLFGQFIEYLGRCIDGGIYDEKFALSDENGFRKDVLQKVQELQVPLLRFPGGTVIKTYHWKDGVGPKADRPKRKNLIWGGINDNHFGTAEFVEYCRKIGAEPFLVINMATGTPEEASDWVEYCNGTGDTYWANLRRKQGYNEPFDVKYWGIGNEEYAATDAGRHQNVEKYVEDGWLFVKLMKLQDPSIKLTLVGNSMDLNWSKRVLQEMHSVCDFLSVHLYSIPSDSEYTTLLSSIDAFNTDFDAMRSLLQTVPEKVENFSSWYRFPPRQAPVKLAVDEWGIWDINSRKGRGDYQMEYTYTWGHALAVGKFLNLFQRNSDIIGLATWAQTVNVLAPIMTNKDASFKQTVYTALKAYRKNTLANNLPIDVSSPNLDQSVKMIDATASISELKNEIVVAALNLSGKESLNLNFNFNNLLQGKQIQLVNHTFFTSPTLESVNDFGKECVTESSNTSRVLVNGKLQLKLNPASVNFIRFKIQ
jgi:alpha-N-arabinofuranosidase